MISFSELNRRDRTDFMIGLLIASLMVGFVVYWSILRTVDPQDTLDQTTTNQVVHSPREAAVPALQDGARAALPRDGGRQREVNVYHKGQAAPKEATEAGGLNISSTGKDQAKPPHLEADIEPDSIRLARIDVNGTNDTILQDKRIDRATIAKSEVSDTVRVMREINEMTSSQRECIIILGAYRKAANVQNLDARLRADGYEVVLSEYKSMTRVGISHSCQERALDSTLTVVRSRYASDAVVLQDQ